MTGCPLCGVSVALLRRADTRSAKEIVDARVETLRRRADELGRGAITPRRLKDDLLWACASCRPLMADMRQIDPQEMRRRIHEEVRRLEHDADRRASRAS